MDRKSQIFDFLTVFRSFMTFLEIYTSKSEILGLIIIIIIIIIIILIKRLIGWKLPCINRTAQFYTETYGPRKCQVFDFLILFWSYFFSKTTQLSLISKI